MRGSPVRFGGPRWTYPLWFGAFAVLRVSISFRRATHRANLWVKNTGDVLLRSLP